MAKSKYAPALFEVINRQKNTGKLGVPKWWKGGPQGAGGEEPASETTAGGEPQARELVEAGTSEGPARPAVTSQSAPDRPAAASAVRLARSEEAVGETESDTADDSVDLSGRWPAVRVESGRLYVALAPTHTAVLGGVFLVALAAAFLLGTAVGGPEPGKDSLYRELMQKPNPAVLDSPAGRTSVPPARAGVKLAEGAGQPEAAGGQVPAEDELKPGSTYVLLCSYPENALASAEHTQKWLAATHNIRTVVRHWKQKEYWLVAVKPFKNRTEAVPFIQQMKELSGDCLKEMKQEKLPLYGFADPMAFEARE